MTVMDMAITRMERLLMHSLMTGHNGVIMMVTAMATMSLVTIATTVSIPVVIQHKTEPDVQILTEMDIPIQMVIGLFMMERMLSSMRKPNGKMKMVMDMEIIQTD